LTDTDKSPQKKKSGYLQVVPAVDEAARLLICLSQSPSGKMNLTDICQNLGIYKSKGYSLLNTLQKHGFVKKNPEGKTYSLGIGLIPLSRRVLDSLNYNDLVAPFLETLTRETHSTALFGLVSGKDTFIVAKREADQNIGITTRVGHRFTLTRGAHGKAIVAFMDTEERRKILKNRELFFHGTPAKLDRKRLQSEFEQCRKLGYALDLGESFPGINILASPVFDSTLSPIGSIFIMGTFPESAVQKYGIIVARCAHQLSARLGANVEQAFMRSEMDL
jgi:DNA-binding IclR family transcriptional regulator